MQDFFISLALCKAKVLWVAQQVLCGWQRTNCDKFLSDGIDSEIGPFEGRSDSLLSLRLDTLTDCLYELRRSPFLLGGAGLLHFGQGRYGGFTELK